MQRNRREPVINMIFQRRHEFGGALGQFDPSIPGITISVSNRSKVKPWIQAQRHPPSPKSVTHGRL